MQRIRELAGKVLPGVFPPEPVVDVLALARDGEVSLAAMGLKLDEGPLDTDGNNALLVACANGHTALVRALLANNASINVTNGEGCNSLHVAAAQDRHEVVQALLELDRDKVTTLTTASCGAGLWQTLHVAASSGAAQTTSLLLSKSGVSDIDGRDMAGNTALVIACCNGHTAVALDLLEHGADATVRNLKGESCLYLAARNGRQDIVERLLCLGKEERDVLIHTAESHGRTPLYAACGAGRVAVVNTLIAAKADVQTKSSDGTSLVHIASRAQGGAEVIGVLLRHGAPVVSLNSFGSTCLHEAGLAGKAETVKAVLAAPEASEMLSMQDFDGLAPLFSACNALRNPSVQGEDAVAAVSAMLDARADPNALDYTGAPPLLHVAWRPERPETLTVARLLLEARANPTLEYEQGWSALHVACNKHSGDATQGEQTEAMRELLYRACEEGHPEYLETFDQEKRRDKEANALYRSQAGPAMRIPIEQRRAVLPSGANVESIAQRLVDSHSVVVLSGAGISVSAGIPDFRSPGEGMYAREDTRRAFDAGFVLEQPDKFYAMLKDTFLPSRYGGPRPTLTHAFIKLLSDKKALRRHITQNIDGLDVAAGVPSDLVVEAHGSFAAARCANASCSKPADDMHAFWTTVKDGGVPRCDACASPLRPNVTFFGEALPERYGDLADADAHNADLLIVLGTSLVVYPFASLVNTVGLLTPRFLINRKPVGPFRDAVGTGMEQGNYRDVAYLGDCDDGVRKLAQLCGWEEQLDEEYKQMLTRLDAEA